MCEQGPPRVWTVVLMTADSCAGQGGQALTGVAVHSCLNPPHSAASHPRQTQPLLPVCGSTRPPNIMWLMLSFPHSSQPLSKVLNLQLSFYLQETLPRFTQD